MNIISSDKIVIDTTLVRQLVDTQFPQWAALPIRPVESPGWDNRTFHLGETMSVRLPSAEGYVPQAAKEQQWLPRLAPHLPLPIPTLLAQGKPNHRFPNRWGIYRWLDGETATLKRIMDADAFAKTLAHFLRCLWQIDSTDGPPAGTHSFFRGAPLITFDAETRQAIAVLQDEIDTGLLTEIWEVASASTWQDTPVWFHGDIASGNLLVKDGRLSAVIDFGCCGIGDPACDLVIAWTLLPARSRDLFRTQLTIDADSWARGRGWALWKALITLQEHLQTGNTLKVMEARHTMNAIVNEYEQQL